MLGKTMCLGLIKNKLLKFVTGIGSYLKHGCLISPGNKEVRVVVNHNKQI